MANEFKIKKGLIVTGATGGTVVDIQGSQGQLFSVTDNLTGSNIFGVSDISGVPILTCGVDYGYSNVSINMSFYNGYALNVGDGANGSIITTGRIFGGDNFYIQNEAIFANGPVVAGMTTYSGTNAKVIVKGNQTFGLPGSTSNNSGRYLSIEGNADGSAEGSGRLFFTEHNSTTAGMDNYGMSLGYRGGATSIVGASGNTWTGLTQIGNGQWGMFGHDNNATGALIMSGDRAATYVEFHSNDIKGVGDIYVGGNQYFNGEFIEGDGKEMFRYNDAWLRINEDNDFSSGIYCGSGVLRTDGAFQVGSGGDKFLVTSAGAVRAESTLTLDNGQIVLGGTGRIQGVDTVSASTDAANKAYVDNQVTTLGQGFTRSGINSSTYTMLCTVAGDRLASVIEMTITGTSGSVVIASSFEIICNHSTDIHVRSMGGDYTDVTIKITSNNNEDYSIEAKHNGGSTTEVEVFVFPRAGETITPTTTDPGYTGAEYEHTASEGWRFGGEDGNSESSNVVIDGKLIGRGGTQLGDINNATTTGTVALKVVEGTVATGPTLGSGAVGAQAVLYSNGLFGMYTGVSNSGDIWMQSQRNDASTSTYDILLNPAGGRVAIGHNNPVGWLDVFRTGTNYAVNLSDTLNRAGLVVKSSGAFDSKIAFSSGAGSRQYIQAVNNAGNTGRDIAINPYGGNVGVGTSAPGQKLTVNGRALIQNSTTPFYIKVNSTYKSWVHHIASNDTYVLAPSTADGGETWDWPNQTSFSTSGVVTANNFVLSSDKRNKTKIEDLTGNNVDISWKSFEMKGNEGEYRTGVIAQELEENYPEFVNTDDRGFKSVKYIDLLIAKIAELEARLEKLEK